MRHAEQRIGIKKALAENRHSISGQSMIFERYDKKWEPVFVPKSRDNKNLKRTFDSIKCHPALEPDQTLLKLSPSSFCLLPQSIARVAHITTARATNNSSDPIINE